MTPKETFEYIVALTIFGTLMLFTPLWGPSLVYTRLLLPMHQQGPTRFQFTVLDIACLFVYLAIANSLLGLIRGEYEYFPTLAVFMLLVTNLFAVLVWTLAFRFANRWNATKPFERTLALLVFFPLSAGAVAQVFLCGLMLIPGGLAFAAGGSNEPILVVTCVLLLFGIVMIYLLRRAWHAILSRTTDSSAVSEF